MKKLFTSLFLISSGIALLAQPQIKSSNMLIGDDFDVYAVSNVSPTSLMTAGANVTWNISTGTNTLGGNVVFVNPSSTPFGTTYPDANFAMKFTIGAGTVYHLFKNSTIGMEEVASDLGGTSSKIFTSYRTFVPATINFGDSVVDPYQKQGQVAATALLKYEAWGTLTTPDSTYTNLGRIVRTDTQGNTFIGWYNQGGRYPVLTYDGTSLLYFKKKSGATGLNSLNTNSAFSIYPNPANETINVNSESKVERIELFDLSGKLLSTVTDNNSMEIADLTSGVYLVKVYTENGNSSQKIVKQ